MASVHGEKGPTSGRPISALPSVRARVLAFTAIVVGGLCGGLIGSSAVKVGCHGSCATPEGAGGLIGAVMAAGGVAVIAVLVLRAMGEWRSIREKREVEAMIAAASATLSTFSTTDPEHPTADGIDDESVAGGQGGGTGGDRGGGGEGEGEGPPGHEPE
jgi:hypothetical protein